MIDEKMMKINLLIDCQRYPLNIHREDEILYREAAKLIDKTLNKYRKWMPDLDSNKHWAMAALELAFNNVSNKDKNVVFGGRLGDYKYYDMDKTIEKAFELANNLL